MHTIWPPMHQPHRMGSDCPTQRRCSWFHYVCWRHRSMPRLFCQDFSPHHYYYPNLRNVLPLRRDWRLLDWSPWSRLRKLHGRRHSLLLLNHWFQNDLSHLQLRWNYGRFRSHYVHWSSPIKILQWWTSQFHYCWHQRTQRRSWILLFSFLRRHPCC
jgi:hypothetical protein